MAIVAARESSNPEFPTFTAVYCGSAELSRAAGADLIVIDLTEGMNADSLPKQRLMRPCIAILARAHFSGSTRAGDRCIRRCSDWLANTARSSFAGAANYWKDLSTLDAEEALLYDIGLRGLLGNSPRFREALAKIPLLGRSGAPVLIMGETGTGKELSARALHFASRRRDGPFLAVDCAAIPDHLFENEMFGHARGAYTDASTAQKGVIGLADHGTLFLDEVDSLSLPAQGKLLRFLEDRKYRPLGAERFFDADIRILAATNSRLDELVTARQFRRDLYYRLNVLSLELPPLRERREDIPILAHHFIAEAAREAGVDAPQLSEATLRCLMAHDWPGNVRELQNLMRRTVVLSDTAELTIRMPVARAAAASTFNQAREQAVEAFERDFIERLLVRHGGNITHAAREAAKERRAFGRLVKKHGLGK